MKGYYAAWFCGAAVVSVVSPAYAEDAPPRNDTQVEDIVVTAQRQDQSLQKVPIAITAVTSGQLAARGLTSTSSLEAAIPSLTITRSGGEVANPYLRGVGSNANSPNDEQSVATYVDGVYYASPIGNIFSFNNIERIEVLKGPQGTLFGRNATGGVIQVITKDPKSTPSLEMNLGYANYQTLTGSAYATAGIAENLAADVAVNFRHQKDGYGINLVNGDPAHIRNEFEIRSKWLFTPSSRTEFRLTGDYTHTVSTGGDYQVPQGEPGADGSGYAGRYNINANLDFAARARVYGVALRWDQDLDFARFVSISAYRHTKAFYAIDSDATPANIVSADISMRARTFSQEVQLLAPKGSALEWLIGAYYFNARYDYNPLDITGAGAGGLPFLDIVSDQRTRSESVYGQATYEILPRLKATGGLRYTHEKQFLDGQFVTVGGPFFVAPTLSQKFEKVTWRAALDYQLTRDVLGYISYNRGIKSGGYSLLAPGSPGYKPEVLDAYEVGLKTELFDRRLRFNIAAFRYDYKNLQVQVIQQGTAFTTNAAAARIQGFDFDFQAIPVTNLTLSGGMGYLHGRYTDYKTATSFPPMVGAGITFDATGNTTINSPKITINGSATYRIPTDFGDFALNWTVIHKSRSFAAPDDRLDYPSYTVLNGSIGWTATNGLGVQFWMKNITDKQYIDSRLETGDGDIQREADPRTYGVTLSAKF